jgi:hypothetical protein
MPPKSHFSPFSYSHHFKRYTFLSVAGKSCNDLSEVVEMLRADIFLPTFDLSEVVEMLRADIFLPTFDLSEVFLSVW